MMMITAVCHRGCANGGECIEPEVCQCVEPYVGLTCRENKQGTLHYCTDVPLHRSALNVTLRGRHLGYDCDP